MTKMKLQNFQIQEALKNKISFNALNKAISRINAIMANNTGDKIEFIHEVHKSLVHEVNDLHKRKRAELFVSACYHRNMVIGKGA